MPDMSAAPAPAQGHHAGRCGGVGLLPTAASGGFTLIEVLVALMIMTLMALMSWRGIDGMARTQALVGSQADAVLGASGGRLSGPALDNGLLQASLRK